MWQVVRSQAGPLWGLFGLCIGLLLFFALSSSAASQHSTPLCGPAEATTLAANRQMRLYELAGSAKQASSVYACSEAYERPRRLGPMRAAGNVWAASMPGPFALARLWAGGIEDRLTGQDTVRVYTAVRNIRTGKARHCSIGGADRPGQLPRVRRVFLTKNGSLAWAAIMKLGAQGPQIGVCESADPRILDSGYGIAIDSVSLRGSTLIWLDAGVRRSAELH